MGFFVLQNLYPTKPEHTIYKVVLFPDVLKEGQWTYIFSRFPEKRKDVTAKISLLTENKIKSGPALSAIDPIIFSENLIIQKNNPISDSPIMNGFNHKNMRFYDHIRN